MAHDPLSLSGQLLEDKYLLEEAVGEGGFAVVYRAQHRIWERPVAIKFFDGLSDLPVERRDEMARSFIQEGALLTDLSARTTTVVQARDVGTYTSPNGHWMPYMVLEWLDGVTLDRYVTTQPHRTGAGLPLEQCIELLTPVAEALSIAHSRGIIHRDIKPNNIFVLSGSGLETPSIKLLDFGVAKVTEAGQTAGRALTKTGKVVSSFTPEYGAPEQFSRKFGATGPWTDQFALAIVLVEMLTGKQALAGLDIAELAYSSSDKDLRPTPAHFGVPVPRGINEIIERALAVLPEERFESIRDFWNALSETLGKSARLPTPPLTPVEPKPVPIVTQQQVPTVTMPEVVPGETPAAFAAKESPQAKKPTEDGSSSLGRWLATAALSLVAAGLGYTYFPSATPAIDPGPQDPTAAAAPVPAEPVPDTPAPSCPEGMILIEGGKFFMGSDARTARDNEKPAHQVSLSSYCIDETEVTVSDYKECSDQGECRRAAQEVSWPKLEESDRVLYSELCNANGDDRGEHPVNCVSWQMAHEYCAAQDKRLPTEAEWEFAARGPDGRVYPWGDETPGPEHLNACGSECETWGDEHEVELRSLYDEGDGFVGTAPVGSFPKGNSRFGLQDIVGNVWEWTADWNDSYSAEAQENPVGPSDGDRKVIRGGGFNGGYASWLRPSFRFAQVPDALSHVIGFRCASGPG